MLARRRFWEMNGVYPVYFVWETGLNETIRDISALVPTRGARGAITDAAIERWPATAASRSGGR